MVSGPFMAQAYSSRHHNDFYIKLNYRVSQTIMILPAPYGSTNPMVWHTIGYIRPYGYSYKIRQVKS
jgi:hypothetical protein